MPSNTRRRLIRGGAALLGLAAAGTAAGGWALSRPEIGAQPAGKRLARIKASPNWADGMFRNLDALETSKSGKSRTEIMLSFLTESNPGRFPAGPVPHAASRLADLPDDHFAWLGHSGFFIRMGGRRLLIDPAMHQAFPFPGFYKPFPGADALQTGDLPPADVLLITHDHYDHLDSATAVALRSRVARVVCPLGVGAHFELWGWAPERITELDWFESTRDGSLTITALPAQHFSGRTFQGNQTLWAGFMLEAGGFRLYHSGDTSFGRHFAMIREAFPTIDLALLEDGQYDEDWPGVHLLPPSWRRAAQTLAPRAVMPIHNSKFCISHHPWKDPLENAVRTADELGLALATPIIGEPVALDPALRPVFHHWWERV